MMSRYEMLDHVSMRIGSLVTKKHRYFSKGTDSQTVGDYLEKLEISLPEMDHVGFYPVEVKNESKFYQAGFAVKQWIGYDAPTIIYHHGAAEGRYDYSFNKIFGSQPLNSANLIAIQGIFCESNRKFLDGIKHLETYTLLLAGSTKLIESIIQTIKQDSDAPVTVTGTSLGGFVTNLHFAHYHTADIYKPMLAGVRMGDLFFKSDYAWVTAESAKKDPKHLQNVLNFDMIMKTRNQKNLFPLLARYDQIVQYELQVQDFEPTQVRTIPYGHASGATRYKLLFEHITSPY